MRLNPKIKAELKKYLLDKIKNNREKVIVYSGSKLSGEEIQLLKSKFPSISFGDAVYRIDENLLAGVKITVGSKVIDLSVKGTLSNLKHIVYEGY